MVGVEVVLVVLLVVVAVVGAAVQVVVVAVAAIGAVALVVVVVGVVVVYGAACDAVDVRTWTRGHGRGRSSSCAGRRRVACRRPRGEVDT